MPRSKSVTVVRNVVQKRPKARKRSRKVGRVSAAVMAAGISPNCTLEYFKSLVNPFETGSIKLGWGCMVPTATPQGYFRGTATTFTDGSITIAVLPAATGAILIYNTGAGAIGPTPINLANRSAIIANCGEGRVVSVGIRAFPNIALTSLPGAAYSGATVATTYAQLLTLSPTDFVALPTSHQSIGTLGVSSTGRPVDPDSFTFQAPVVDANGWIATANQNSSIPFSVPYVTFLNLPATTGIFYEVVINYEATQVVAHGSQTILADNDAQQETVADTWPTPESLFHRLSNYLPHPGRAGEAAASTDTSFLTSMWNGIKGVGRRALVSGATNFAGAAFRSASMQLLGGDRLSGQRYGRSYAGYLT